MNERAETAVRERQRLRVHGMVQGVGFRPFVYRIAVQLGLVGFVNNDSNGVVIEIEGPPETVEHFQWRFWKELPPLAHVVALRVETVPVQNEDAFVIVESRRGKTASTLIAPDVATCDACLQEIFDPADRRYRYPFTNCTNCGPRYTIVRSIPYDRPNTSMAVFPMCPECEREYHDPLDRRFHAQPNACPICGPKLSLFDQRGQIACEDVIETTIQLLREGKIVAMRGIGGFHLAVDALDEEAVQKLRARKGRAEKPFALMAPDIAAIRKYCLVLPEEEPFLKHYTRPIMLLRKRADTALAPSVAPRQKYVGFMLPYTPLHHLLMRGQFDALVMTSGNYSEEPIAIGNDEARDRLNALADYFVLHDREILQRCDDSVVRRQAGELRMTRRSRGYVPFPVFLEEPTRRPILAVGGELKNTIALTRGNEVFLSQHIGDLDNPSAFAFFEHSIKHLSRILEMTPEIIAYDLHPEYLSTQWAMKQPLPRVSVQHHHAHLVSVMAENGVSDKTIGIILDGTGYGTDGTIWGGEVLVGDACGFERYAWLEPVVLPGGAQAIAHPWRMAMSYLHHAYGDAAQELKTPLVQCTPLPECQLLTQIIAKRLNSPMTSSCGRLFDGVAALLGLRREVSYEAQAAMELEALADVDVARQSRGYDETLSAAAPSGALPLKPLIRALVADIERGEASSVIAAKFHRTVVEMFVTAAIGARNHYGIGIVGLSGGVYQNTLFFELMVRRLTEEKFKVLTHSKVPTNDGGLALGQVVIADAGWKDSGR